MKTLLVLPMKSAAQAKTRLSPAMSPQRRAHLALTLFDRAQNFFAAHFPQFDRLVVTPSQDIALRALQAGAQVLLEPAAQGLDPAAARALAWAQARGYERLLLVPTDIPVWLLREAHALLHMGTQADLVIARAHDGGTNALLLDLRRVRHFQFHYGPDSARRHARAAQMAGLRVHQCCLPFMSRDIDTPDDCLVMSHSLQMRKTA